jgi:hypothetical protein
MIQNQQELQTQQVLDAFQQYGEQIQTPTTEQALAGLTPSTAAATTEFGTSILMPGATGIISITQAAQAYAAQQAAAQQAAAQQAAAQQAAVQIQEQLGSSSTSEFGGAYVPHAGFFGRGGAHPF